MNRLARTYMSAAFACAERWAAAKASPLVAACRPDELYAAIERNVAAGKPPAAEDVDLLALAAAARGSHRSELRDSLHKLRLSAKAFDLMDSTSHSVARAYLEAGELGELLEIVDDRINYGVFLDEFAFALVVDEALVAGDVERAARFASQLMLQEDFLGPIPRSLAAFACREYLAASEPPRYEPPPPPPKKVEEIKIRVGYLRTYDFDDHFDLREPIALAAKTLAKSRGGGATPVDLNAALLGWTFYEKSDRAKEVAARIGAVCEDVRALIERREASLRERGWPEKADSTASVLAELKTTELAEFTLKDALSNELRAALDAHEASETERHRKTFDAWDAIRREKLKKHLETLENLKREADIEARKRTLEDLNKKLWFFDNKEKVELMIDDNIPRYPKTWTGRKKASKKATSEYIPPQV